MRWASLLLGFLVGLVAARANRLERLLKVGARLVLNTPILML